MEQTLKGVAFPNAAAAKAELLHSHDTRSPHISRPKTIERPWMGFGDGKDMVKAQDQMMKRKRGELTTASTISVVSATGSATTARSGEEFELGFLRHDGHFEQGRKKGPVVTFVKQYFQEKWREHTQESRPVSKNNRLEYAKSREKIQPMSKIKRWGYATTTVRTQPLKKNKRLEYATAQESQLVSNSKTLEHTTTGEDTRPMSNRLNHVAVKEETRSLSEAKKLDNVTTKEEMVPMGNSKRLDHATAREETKLGSLNKRLDYEEAMEERDLESRTKRLDYVAEKEETKSVSWSKRMDYATENEETESTSWSKRLDYATKKEEPLVSKSKRLEYVVAMEETNPTLSKSKKLDDGIDREETDLVTQSKRLDYAIEKEETQMSKSKRLDYAVAMEETKPINKSKRLDYVIVKEDMEPISRSKELEDPFGDPLEDDETQPMKRLKDLTVKASQTSDYAQTDEVEEDTHSDSSLTNNMLPCGTDCNQIRTEIFRKVNTLMAQAKPEKLYLKPRSKTPRFIDQDEDQGGTLTTGHQVVQTIFTENKKVQTRYNEPKQVQWAILPKDSLMNSPKVTGLVNENQKPPKEKILFRDDSILMPYNERQTFRDDSILMKVSIEPKRERDSKDSRHVSTEVESDGRATNDSQVDSLYLSPTKRTKGQHHLLLYQEAMEIQKEQKDLERAREERRDFWSSYERELKRGRGLHVEEYEIERKGKRTIEEETPRFVEEPAPMKTKLTAFLDEHLSLTSTSRASSSPQVGSKSSQEAAAIFQQLLDKVESYETSPKEDNLVGLQGLRKVESVDSLQCLEAMEKQLYPEIAHIPGQLSPTELDYMKAAILSHNFYPRLVTSFINQHKASAPPDQVERLERIRQQVIKSWRPLGKPAGNPAQQEKVKKYQDILTKFERELEKPCRDAMDFSWQMEHYLDTIPRSRGISEIGSSGSNNLKDFTDEQDPST